MAAEWTLHPILSPGDSLRPNVWFVAHYTEEGQEDADATAATAATGPSARLGHSCVCATASGRVVVFGGANPAVGVLNDVHVFDLATLAWSTPKALGPAPQARYDHAAVLDEDRGCMWVLMGSDSEGMLNDVHCLDLATTTWTPVEAAGTAPAPRTLHSAAAIGTSIFVFGGGATGSNPVADDRVHTFDTRTRTWRTLDTTGTRPALRHGHTMCAVGKRLVVFGGMAGAEFFGDVHELDTDTLKWSRRETRGAPPQARSGHAACVVGNRMYVQGGISLTPAGPVTLTDLLFLDLDSMTWASPKLECAPVSARLDHTLISVPFRCLDGPPPADDAGPAKSQSTPEPGAEAAAAKVGPGEPTIVDITSRFGVDGVPVDPSSAAAAAAAVPRPAAKPAAPKPAASVATTTEEGVVQDVLLCFGGMEVEGEIYDDALMLHCR